MLRQLIQQGANFIVAHASGYDTIAARLSQQYKVPMITYDVPTNLKKGTLSYITTSSQQAAYLAGVLAAKTTKTHKIGIVISAADDNWYKMSGGFAKGFRSVDKTSKIFFATVSPTGYDDAAGGKRVADSVIAQGADVLFTMGDNASFGYLQAVESAKVGHKVWMIGDIGNMAPIDRNHVFLSSVLWNFTSTFRKAIQDVNNGSYGTHGYNLDLKNGGVSLLRTKYIPKAAWAAVTAAKKQILAGKIKIPVIAQGLAGPEADQVGTHPPRAARNEAGLDRFFRAARPRRRPVNRAQRPQRRRSSSFAASRRPSRASSPTTAST